MDFDSYLFVVFGSFVFSSGSMKMFLHMYIQFVQPVSGHVCGSSFHLFGKFEINCCFKLLVLQFSQQVTFSHWSITAVAFKKSELC